MKHKASGTNWVIGIIAVIVIFVFVAPHMTDLMNMIKVPESNYGYAY